MEHVAVKASSEWDSIGPSKEPSKPPQPLSLSLSAAEVEAADKVEGEDEEEEEEEEEEPAWIELTRLSMSSSLSRRSPKSTCMSIPLSADEPRHALPPSLPTRLSASSAVLEDEEDEEESLWPSPFVDGLTKKAERSPAADASPSLLAQHPPYQHRHSAATPAHVRSSTSSTLSSSTSSSFSPSVASSLSSVADSLLAMSSLSVGARQPVHREPAALHSPPNRKERKRAASRRRHSMPSMLDESASPSLLASPLPSPGHATVKGRSWTGGLADTDQSRRPPKLPSVNRSSGAAAVRRSAHSPSAGPSRSPLSLSPTSGLSGDQSSSERMSADPSRASSLLLPPAYLSSSDSIQGPGMAAADQVRAASVVDRATVMTTLPTPVDRDSDLQLLHVAPRIQFRLGAGGHSGVKSRHRRHREHPLNLFPLEVWEMIVAVADFSTLWALKDTCSWFQRFLRPVLVRRLFMSNDMMAALYSWTKQRILGPDLWTHCEQALPHDTIYAEVESLADAVVRIIYQMHVDVQPFIVDRMAQYFEDDRGSLLTAGPPPKYTDTFEDWVHFDASLGGIEREQLYQSFLKEVGRRGSGVVSMVFDRWERHRLEVTRVLQCELGRLWCVIGKRRYPFSHQENKSWKERRKLRCVFDDRSALISPLMSPNSHGGGGGLSIATKKSPRSRRSKSTGSNSAGKPRRKRADGNRRRRTLSWKQGDPTSDSDSDFEY